MGVCDEEASPVPGLPEDDQPQDSDCYFDIYSVNNKTGGHSAFCFIVFQGLDRQFLQNADRCGSIAGQGLPKPIWG